MAEEINSAGGIQPARRFEKQQGAWAQPQAAQLPARGKPRKSKKGTAAVVRVCSWHILTVNSGPLKYAGL